MVLVSTIALATALLQPERGSVQPQPPVPIVTLPIAPTPAVASPAAGALAEAIVDNLGVLTPERVKIEIASSITGWRSADQHCDPNNAECMRVARELVDGEAPGYVAAIREGITRNLGAHFDKVMTPDQIAEARQFFGGPASRAMLRSLGDLPRIGEAGFRELSAIRAARLGALRTEFARRTAGLPRASAPRPPAAPPPVLGRPYPQPVPPPPPPRN